MKIAVAKEIDPSEPRVAASPDTVKKFKALGVDIAVEPGAGIKSGLPDSEFTAAGAVVSADALKDADIVIKVRRPEASELANYKRGALIIAIMDPYGNEAALKAMADAGVSAFAMELMPRITRAQAMDVLSSQANLAGYRAVESPDAAQHELRCAPAQEACEYEKRDRHRSRPRNLPYGWCAESRRRVLQNERCRTPGFPQLDFFPVFHASEDSRDPPHPR
jgi:NAD/NADP transhydrogenase alpha subunit